MAVAAKATRKPTPAKVRIARPVPVKQSPAQKTRDQRIAAASLLSNLNILARSARSQHRPRLDEMPAREGYGTFAVVKPPKGVLPPEKDATFAMDMQPTQDLMVWAGAGIAAGWTDGLQFLGYPYLSELAQRPEYRRIVEVIATEMTRKWIKLQSRGKKDLTAKIAELEKEMIRLNVRDIFKRLAEQDGFFGRSHLYIDTGDTQDADELKTDIGNGRNDASQAKVKPSHPVLRIRTVEALWTYPTNYNSSDPLEATWYKPDMWFVMGKQVHSSRLLTFIGREVPDLLKPAYSFGGLSLTQMAKPYVTNWLQTRQSVNDAVNGFATWKLLTNMAAAMMPGGTESMIRRAQVFDELRDTRGLFVVDKDTEDLQNVAMPLGSLDALQAQSQEHMASVSGIPLVKLLGITPSGLNVSTDGEIRSFYDWIAAYQIALFFVQLNRVIDFLQLSLWGKIENDIVFEFEPLWAMDDKELAEMEKNKADTHDAYVSMGAIWPAEVRTALADDPDSIYKGLDPDDVPDLLEEEQQGLEPAGGRPQPQAAGATPAKPGAAPPAAKKKAAAPDPRQKVPA